MPRRLALLGLLLLLTPPAACGQEAPPETYHLQVDVRLVNVDVAVTDAEGNFIQGLERENFRVREDGTEQTLAHFAPARAPVRIVLLVEASPAVFLIRRDHLTAAYRLLEMLRPEDEVALVSYAAVTHRETDFTRDKPGVAARLNALGRFGLGMADVNLLDAVADTLDWLSPPPRRTAVLVIGTGLDSGSRTPWPALKQRIGSSQVTFFAVAVGRLLLGEGKPKKDKNAGAEISGSASEDPFTGADQRLEALAKASAGEVFFPESAADLDAAYRRIGERLRNLYSLGYYPTNTARDGAYRQISVELVDKQGGPLVLRNAKGKPIDYRVYTRPGYFAPSD